MWSDQLENETISHLSRGGTVLVRVDYFNKTGSLTAILWRSVANKICRSSRYSVGQDEIFRYLIHCIFMKIQLNSSQD